MAEKGKALVGIIMGSDTDLPVMKEAAATLGAGRWTVFTRVTLPMVAPGAAVVPAAPPPRMPRS